MKNRVVILFILALYGASIGHAEGVTQGTIKGKMMIKDGSPMSDGAVLVYSAKGPLPLPDKYFRVPDNVVFIDEDGKFSAEIASGTYYIGAMKKKTGKGPGPPKDGDYFFISMEAGGTPRAYVLNENASLDIGILSEAVPYKGITDREGVTAIEGTILNEQGKPVEGVVVFAELTVANDIGISFVSNWTGKDGKYFLRVHEGGTYNLNATDFMDSHVIYGLEMTEPMSVMTGEVLSGINLKVEKSSK